MVKAVMKEIDDSFAKLWNTKPAEIDNIFKRNAKNGKHFQYGLAHIRKSKSFAETLITLWLGARRKRAIWRPTNKLPAIASKQMQVLSAFPSEWANLLICCRKSAMRTWNAKIMLNW